MPNGLHRRLLGRVVSVDDEAVARVALRELAAVRPVSFAAVEYQSPLAWSRHRFKMSMRQWRRQNSRLGL